MSIGSESSPLFTVGHSTLSADAFVALLNLHEIEAVGDVRSMPYSEFNPQFNREPLRALLEKSGVEYFFVGNALGGRFDGPAYYTDGVVDYEKVAQCAVFRKGLDQAEEYARDHRLALMCSEKDPLQCHRFLLISRQLQGRPLRIRHILEGGVLEDQAETERRLLREWHLDGLDLFRSEAEVLDDAYARQAAKAAYRKTEVKAS